MEENKNKPNVSFLPLWFIEEKELDALIYHLKHNGVIKKRDQVRLAFCLKYLFSEINKEVKNEESSF